MKKEIINRIISIITVSLFLITVTNYIYLPNSEKLASALTFYNSERSFYMQDITEGILLHDATPTKDSVGLENKPYTFKVVNNSNKEVTYKIVFKNTVSKEQEKDLLPSRYLRYSISDNNDETMVLDTLNEDGILLTTVIPAKSEQVLNFRMWLDYDADEGAFDKIFSGKITIERNK